MTEMIGHIAETAGHDEPKTRSVTMDRNPRSRCRNHRSRWSEIRKIVAIDQRIHGRTFIPQLPGLQVMKRLMQEETTPQTSMV